MVKVALGALSAGRGAIVYDIRHMRYIGRVRLECADLLNRAATPADRAAMERLLCAVVAAEVERELRRLGA